MPKNSKAITGFSFADSTIKMHRFQKSGDGGSLLKICPIRSLFCIRYPPDLLPIDRKI